MLGSFARKLRIYGFDTLYDSSLDDEELIRLAHLGDVILLTSDRELHVRAVKKGVNSVLVVGDTDAARLVAAFRALKISPIDINPDRSRCPLCNGELTDAKISSVKSSVSLGVLRRQQKFYKCQECGKIYWKGSHWSRIESLAREVRQKLAET